MSTHSSARNLFPPLDNPELTIQRRSHTDHTLLNNSEMAAEGNGDLPVPDLQTMEELCQPSLNGQGGPIAPIAIQETKFRLKRGTFMKRRLEECYDLIENMTAHHNDWDTSAQWSESSSSITSSSDTEIAALKAKMAEINKNLMRVLQVNQQVRAVTLNCETCGGPHSFSDCPATVGNTQKVYATGAYQGDNQKRNQFFQGANQVQNQPPAYQAPVYQAPVYQALVHQPQIPQPQVATTNEFTNFMKANDVIPKNMQTNMTSLTNSNLELKNMFGQFMKMNTVSSSGSGTLPGNTITNLKEDLKGIITQSRTAYQGPTIPNTSNSLPPLVERETEATKDMVHPTNNENTKDAVLLKKLPEKLGDPGKFLIPCDFPRMAECLALADLGASINLMPLSVWNKLSLPDLYPTCRTLELADRLISRPVGVAEDVFIKVGTFYFPADFVVVDFDADHRVPLILRGYFLKIGRALIDVFEGELTLHVGKEAITFNLDQTSRYSANYNDMTANQIDVIDMACEEYSQEVLGFSNVIASGNPTPYYDPIVSTTFPTLTLFENSDFLFEEVDAFLALEDDPTLLKVDQSYVELKDLPPHLEYAFLEGNDKFPIIIAKDLSKEEKTALITEDFEPAVQHKRRVNPEIYVVIKNEGGFTVVENGENELILTRLVMGWRVCIDYQKMLKWCEDTNLCLNWEKSHFMVKKGIVLVHKISKNGIEVDKAKVDVIAKLPHPISVKGINSFLGHASFYQRFIKYFSKIAQPMTRLLEKDTLFLFSKEYVEAFQALKIKLTEAPILIVTDWDLPFELMCDASDFAIGAVLRQCQEKHFRPIHYASKTMTEVESNYTITEKEMLSVVYAFEKFRYYLIMNKSIVYTDHSALKYLFAKKYSKARLLRWVLLL
nr:hypothetical protein [Tanacetum cinerariifolium]